MQVGVVSWRESELACWLLLLHFKIVFRMQHRITLEGINFKDWITLDEKELKIILSLVIINGKNNIIFSSFKNKLF